MELLRLLFASLLLLPASAVSDGNLPTCNVDMPIGRGTSVMKWVDPPVFSGMYSIESTTTSYTPGTLTPITITVKELDYIYIGLLLVALSSGTNNTAQGKWYIRDGDDFFLPATCKFSAVVHASAELKPIEQTFYWEGAPNQGTVTFRALIKQGEQNHGSFYKPANLVLTENKSAPPARTVWKSERGHSCNDACGRQNMACDQAGTLSLNSVTTLRAGVRNYYGCREPLLKFCGPPAMGANAQCFYHACGASQSFDVSTTCSRRSSDSRMDQQFCACKAGPALLDQATPVANASSSLGFRLAKPVELSAELIINSLEIKDGKVIIDLTGPQDRWFAIAWGASYMDGAYTTVVSLDKAGLRIPQNYEAIEKGVVDADQGWYDLKCQQACLDYCRTLGNPRYFSCAVTNSTNQRSAAHNASDPNTYSAANASRVPCKDGKIAPFLQMSVSEWKLNSTIPNRGATRLPSTVEVIRTVVEGGQFRIEFSRPIAGAIPFPVERVLPIIWSIGVHQYFGQVASTTNPKPFSKHASKGGYPKLQFVPIYPVCAPRQTEAPSERPIGLNSGASTLPSMLLLGSLAALGSKNWIVGLLLAVLVKPASAHNWVNTPSRAQVAAVTIPCVARVDPAPHLQVIPGQEFQMEWSTGHGDTPTLWTYWIFLKEENYNMLNTITDADMEDYLNKAPTPSLLTGNKWTRRHLAPYRNWEAGCASCNNGSQYPTVFAKHIQPGDPLYITRNTVAVAKSLKSGDKNVSQWWYPTGQIAGDKRAEYQSLKYPAFIAVHKFRIPNHWPDEYDVATFRFPPGLAPGNYIAHFKWGGYRDCTDVHITNIATDTENPWGRTGATDGLKFVRLDHCEYTYVRNPSTRCTPMIAGNASKCLADCLSKSYSSCSGVQGVRRTNPAETLRYVPNYPTKLYTYNTSGDNVFPPPEFGPCDSRTIKKRFPCANLQPLCNQTEIDAFPSNYLCYGLSPYRDQDFQTTDDYVISTDPRDPGFYSTCWVRLTPGGFLPSPPPVVPPPVWQVGQRCLDCNWLATKYSAYSYSTAPNWEESFTSECSDCNLAAATECKADATFVEGGRAGNCTTAIGNGVTCSATCDSGFELFGASRVCQNNILLGFSQSCTFRGC